MTTGFKQEKVQEFQENCSVTTTKTNTNTNKEEQRERKLQKNKQKMVKQQQLKTIKTDVRYQLRKQRGGSSQQT